MYRGCLCPLSIRYYFRYPDVYPVVLATSGRGILPQAEQGSDFGFTEEPNAHVVAITTFGYAVGPRIKD